MNLKKILGFGIGPIVTAMLGFITAPLIAWMFSPEDIGRLYMAQTVISFSVILFTLGLDQAYVREFHVDPDRHSLLRATFLPGLVVMMVLVIATFVFSRVLSQWLYGLSDPIYWWLTLGTVAVVFFAKYPSLVLRMHERALGFSLTQILPKVVFVACLLLILGASLATSFLTLQIVGLVSSAAVVVVTVWMSRQEITGAFYAKLNAEKLGQLLRYGLPLVGSGLVYWALTATSALAIRALSSFDELGIYSVAMSLASFAIVFQAIVSVIWAPIVFKWDAATSDMGRVTKVAKLALAVCAGILVCSGMFSWLVDLLLPPQYESVKFLVMCSLVQPLLYTLAQITGIGIGVMRRPIMILWSTVVAFIVNILLNILLVPAMGASGAVIANAIAFFAYFALCTEVSARIWRRLLRARDVIVIMCGVAFCIATVLWGPAVGSFWVAFGWLVAFFVIFVEFLPEWRELVGQVKGLRG